METRREDRIEEKNEEDNMKRNEIEMNKVGLMRAFVESQDPTSKEVDDLMIRRFLRARDLDIEKASALFLKYLKWRHAFVPNGFISSSEIPNELTQKKMFAQGFDKKGQPIVVVLGARNIPIKEKGGLDEFKRFVVFTLDKTCARMPSGPEKFVSIADLKGWGYANWNVRAYLGALSILQDCYPERLGKLFLIHVPYVFMAVWKIIYPFIDNNTKKKNVSVNYGAVFSNPENQILIEPIYALWIQFAHDKTSYGFDAHLSSRNDPAFNIVFVENKRLKSTLLEDIDESQLPEIYGGKLPLVPIEDS